MLIGISIVITARLPPSAFEGSDEEMRISGTSDMYLKKSTPDDTQTSSTEEEQPEDIVLPEREKDKTVPQEKGELKPSDEFQERYPSRAGRGTRRIHNVHNTESNDKDINERKPRII